MKVDSIVSVLFFYLRGIGIAIGHYRVSLESKASLTGINNQRVVLNTHDSIKEWARIEPLPTNQNKIPRFFHSSVFNYNSLLNKYNLKCRND